MGRAPGARFARLRFFPRLEVTSDASFLVGPLEPLSRAQVEAPFSAKASGGDFQEAPLWAAEGRAGRARAAPAAEVPSFLDWLQSGAASLSSS